MATFASLSRQLEAGVVTSRSLVEAALAKIAEPNGQGAQAFVFVDREGARAQAEEMGRLRAAGRAPSALAGIPISVKDLFDLKGQVTRAGSRVLADQPPAERDAVAIARLRAAGLIPIGRTNMTEFAFSGLGLNPHYGTPLSPFEREIRRIPGGSSSGAAVSVADDIVAAGIGTDTGGSCRIPAAFCGIVGFKPTARRVDLTGTFPLSKSLDSIGPLARSVDCCARLDAVLSGESNENLVPRPIDQLRLGVLQNYVLEQLDGAVAACYEDALNRLSAKGVKLVDFEIPDLDELPILNARGGIVAAEAYAVHEDLLAQHSNAYDQRVSSRIMRATEQSPNEFQALLDARARMCETANALTSPFDAVVMPTVPIVPPTFDELEDDTEYGRINLLALRNPTVGNFLDRCAISLPISDPNAAPVGLMLMGETMSDRALFSIAASVAQLFKPGA